MNWTDNVRARLTDVNIQESLRVAARDTIAIMGPRIFDRGERPDGSDIGTYSSSPLVMKETQMTKKGAGEPAGEGERFFSGGYRQYKQQTGRNPNIFNMRNFGVMMRDFLSGKETYSGKQVTVTFKQKRSIDIINSDRRMQKALGMSKTERENFSKVFNFEFQKRVFPS